MLVHPSHDRHRHNSGLGLLWTFVRESSGGRVICQGEMCGRGAAGSRSLRLPVPTSLLKPHWGCHPPHMQWHLTGAQHARSDQLTTSFSAPAHWPFVHFPGRNVHSGALLVSHQAVFSALISKSALSSVCSDLSVVKYFALVIRKKGKLLPTFNWGGKNWFSH